jgi:hypothetical protein
MEQITVTKYKAKDGTIFDSMGDATDRDRVLDRKSRLSGVVEVLRPELTNAFRYGLLNDGGNQSTRASIMIKLAEIIEDNFDKITKSRMDAVKSTAPTT